MADRRKVTPDAEVHYYADGSPRTGPFEAVVTAVDEERGTVDLRVKFPTALRDKAAVPFSESPRKHHWCWPPAR